MTDSIQIMTASATERRPTHSIRAMSLPSLTSSRKTTMKPTSSPQPFPTYPDLPPDPTSWSSAHVAAYLTYCLRLYPPAIIKDLSRYVQQDATLNGRRFLRLKEEQLRRMGFNERWIKLIIEGKRALRRENLTQKILMKGDGLILEEMEEIGEENDMEDNDVFLEKDISESPVEDKELIHTDLEKHKEVLQQKPEKSFWLNVSSPTLKECLGLEDLTSLTQFSYGNGLLHGATIGAMAVWLCMRLAKQ